MKTARKTCGIECCQPYSQPGTAERKGKKKGGR